MTPDQIEQIKKAVGESIQVHVNGKIDKMNTKLDDYIITDNAWKKEADPYIKGLANVSGAAKLVVWLAISVSSVVGAILAIKNLLK